MRENKDMSKKKEPLRDVFHLKSPPYLRLFYLDHFNLPLSLPNLDISCQYDA